MDVLSRELTLQFLQADTDSYTVDRHSSLRRCTKDVYCVKMHTACLVSTVYNAFSYKSKTAADIATSCEVDEDGTVDDPISSIIIALLPNSLCMDYAFTADQTGLSSATASGAYSATAMSVPAAAVAAAAAADNTVDLTGDESPLMVPEDAHSATIDLTL